MSLARYALRKLIETNLNAGLDHMKKQEGYLKEILSDLSDEHLDLYIHTLSLTEAIAMAEYYKRQQ